jgi:hypothetical protein
MSKNNLAIAYAAKRKMRKDVDAKQDFLSDEEASESPFQDVDNEDFLSADMQPLEPVETSDEAELTESGFLPEQSPKNSKLSNAIRRRLGLR